MVLICISLMTNVIEHLFMCLFATCISSLERCLFRFFVHFLIGCFSFCWAIIILYNLDISPLSGMLFINTFFPFVSCFSLTWRYTLKHKDFYFNNRFSFHLSLLFPLAIFVEGVILSCKASLWDFADCILLVWFDVSQSLVYPINW